MNLCVLGLLCALARVCLLYVNITQSVYRLFISENFMVEALYRDVVGEFSRYKNEGVFSRNALAHWIVPSPNLNTNPLTEIPSHSQFNYKVYRPRPFLSPANVNPRSENLHNLLFIYCLS